MLHYNKRQINRNHNEISFLTPKMWLNDLAIVKQYEGLHFKRDCHEKDRLNLLGAGHKLINRALEQAMDLTSCVAQLPTLQHPIIIYQILDRVTGTQSNIQQVLVGLLIDFEQSENIKILKDWEILLLLNDLSSSINKATESTLNIDNYEKVTDVLGEAENYLKQNLAALDLPFRIPLIQLNAVIFPKALEGDRC
jgi:hypothetical protein